MSYSTAASPKGATGGSKSYTARVAPGGTLPGPEGWTRALTRPASSQLAVLESRSHTTTESEMALAHAAGWTTTRMGSSVKFCLIASGEADVCLRPGPTMEWDVAAGDAILRAAGGVMVAGNGEPFQYGKAGYKTGTFVALGDSSLKLRVFGP